MGSVNLSIKYRPVKIGFLVDYGDIEGIIRIAGINTLLWGGIYNPIIPVCEDKNDLTQNLTDLFCVDVLFPINNKSKQINDFISKNTFYEIPYVINSSIFYDSTSDNKKKLKYIDVFDLLSYRRSEKNNCKTDSHKKDFLFPSWIKDDKYNALFSVLFGYYPEEYEFEKNPRELYLSELKAKEVLIGKNQKISKDLAVAVSPIKLTSRALYYNGDGYFHSGVYIGEGNNFDDLVNFWNIRASGIDIRFLPEKKYGRFKSYIQSHIDKSSQAKPTLRGLKYPDIEFYFFNRKHITKDPEKFKEEIKEKAEIVNSFNFHNTQGRKSIVSIDEATWNGFNIKPAHVYFNRESALGSVDKEYNHYTVSISLPEKRFILDKQISLNPKYLAVSINPIGESAYQGYTLKPPFIRKLNSFYGISIKIDPFKIRTEHDGIAVIIENNDNTLKLFPINNQSIICEIFKISGITSEISQAGRITDRLLEKLKDLHKSNIFKFQGVRELLNKSVNEGFTRGDGTNKINKIISSKEEFDKLKKYSDKSPDPNIIFNDLLYNDFLRAGLELKCDSCNLLNWLSLRVLDDSWKCEYCGYDNITSVHLKHRGDWKFRTSGLFAKDNNQEGAIPVLLTLLFLSDIIDTSIYSFSMSLKIRNVSQKNHECETDFCFINQNYFPPYRREKIELCIGECKSEAGHIDKNDIDNLAKVRTIIMKSIDNIECYIVFSKLSDIFCEDEIELFKNFKENNPDVGLILLTSDELCASYHNWSWIKNKDLPSAYTGDLRNLSLNCEYVYLR